LAKPLKKIIEYDANTVQIKPKVIESRNFGRTPLKILRMGSDRLEGLA